MLATDHRAASALMSNRYPAVQDFELVSAMNEAHPADEPLTMELPPVRAVTARIRVLLHRRGIAHLTK